MKLSLIILNFSFLYVVEGYTLEKCGGKIQILSPELFYAFNWITCVKLVETKSREEWNEIFKNSYTQDFFSSSTKNSIKIMKARNYGQKMPAMSHLGPLMCPLAYYSEKLY